MRQRDDAIALQPPPAHRRTCLIHTGALSLACVTLVVRSEARSSPVRHVEDLSPSKDQTVETSLSSDTASD